MGKIYIFLLGASDWHLKKTKKNFVRRKCGLLFGFFFCKWKAFIVLKDTPSILMMSEAIM